MTVNWDLNCGIWHLRHYLLVIWPPVSELLLSLSMLFDLYLAQHCLWAFISTFWNSLNMVLNGKWANTGVSLLMAPPGKLHWAYLNGIVISYIPQHRYTACCSWVSKCHQPLLRPSDPRCCETSLRDVSAVFLHVAGTISGVRNGNSLSFPMSSPWVPFRPSSKNWPFGTQISRMAKISVQSRL